MHDVTGDNLAPRTEAAADLRSTLLDLIQAAWTTQAIHTACELGRPTGWRQGRRRWMTLRSRTNATRSR